MEFLNGSYLFVYFAGTLQQYEIARLDENLTFIYSNNETNETVWPGESMHTLTGLFPPKTGGYYYGKLPQKDEHKARLYQD